MLFMMSRPFFAGWLVGVVCICAVQARAADSPSMLTQCSLCQSDDVSGDRESSPAASSGDAVSSTFHWKGVLAQSALLLGTQHALRMVQKKTRYHLDGPFWSDYMDSLEGLHGWNDGNPIVTNYGGHPMMGAIAGFIQIQNDPRGMSLEWDPQNPAYWKSRFKALGWAALYSTGYELAPWGEAGIGNVGRDRGTMGFIDLVITPLGGFGMMLLEDYLDKKVIRNLERGKSPETARVLRVLLNPQRSVANMMRIERPSYRDTRTNYR
jgi:hypothetical protein